MSEKRKQNENTYSKPFPLQPASSSQTRQHHWNNTTRLSAQRGRWAASGTSTTTTTTTTTMTTSTSTTTATTSTAPTTTTPQSRRCNTDLNHRAMRATSPTSTLMKSATLLCMVCTPFFSNAVESLSE